MSNRDPAETVEHLDLHREHAPMRNVYHLARLAESVYHDEPHTLFPELDLSFPQCVEFERERVFGMVSANDEHVVLTFRGNDENREWVESLAYGQVPWGQGRAHGGFARLLDSVWKDILAAFFDTRATDKTLWLTGHSLGGCLTTLAAHRLETEGFDPFFACTFGTPRVLDTSAADAFATPLYRIVNNEDPVPDVPWPTLTESYSHVGDLRFLLPSGELAENRHSKHLARRIDRANTIGEGILPAGVVHDHSMSNYLKKLKRHA